MVRTNLGDACKKAITGAWYEAMVAMSSGSDNSIEIMAEMAGGSLEEFKAQLETTSMFYEASQAAAFAASEDIKQTMDYVRQFSFSHGLFAEAPDPDSGN